MNLHKLFGFVSLVSIVGCTDASQMFGSDGEGGSGGSTSSGSHHNNTDNPPHDDGCDLESPCDSSSPACVSDGVLFTCQCGVMLPDHSMVECNTGSTSSSTTTSSGNGGSTTVTTGGGNEGGAGGAGSTTSSGGSTSASTSSSTASSTSASTSTSSSSSSSSSTGTGGGPIQPGTPVGELKITIVPQSFGSHNITIMGDEIPYRTGGVTWGNPSFVANNVTRITIVANVLEGSAFEFSGYIDPPGGGASVWTNQLCDPNSLKSRAAVWASFDDDTSDNVPAKPTARVTVQSNGQGGCEFRVIAIKSPLISASDTDGDGVTPAQGDSHDYPNGGQAWFPTQVESPDDNEDLNNDGFVNPARAIYMLTGAIDVQSGTSPTLHGSGSGPGSNTSVLLHWVSGPNRWESDPIEMEKAPQEFYFTWNCPSSGTCYDSSFWGGSCHEQVTDVAIREDHLGNFISDWLQSVGNPAFTCHRFGQANQFVP